MVSDFLYFFLYLMFDYFDKDENLLYLYQFENVDDIVWNFKFFNMFRLQNFWKCVVNSQHIFCLSVHNKKIVFRIVLLHNFIRLF